MDIAVLDLIGIISTAVAAGAAALKGGQHLKSRAETDAPKVPSERPRPKLPSVDEIRAEVEQDQALKALAQLNDNGVPRAWCALASTHGEALLERLVTLGEKSNAKLDRLIAIEEKRP